MGERSNLQEVISRVRGRLFRDTVEVTIFLGALCFVGLLWRTSVTVNDSVAVANGLTNVMDGHLAIERIRLTLSAYPGRTPYAPGVHVHDKTLYAENYGQIFLTVPVAFLLTGVSRVADLLVVAFGFWSLLLVGFCRCVGRLFDRRRLATVVGVTIGVAVFVLNTALAPALDAVKIPLLAMQLVTSVAAATTGVVIYRFVAKLYGRRQGGVAGVLLVVATPVGFWATIPLRHVLVALLALLTTYWFYLSRTAGSETKQLQYRALSYLPVGFTTWVFAPEGFILLVSLGVVDVVTAKNNGVRHLVVVAGVTGVSLIPFFLMNVLISGNPLRPVLLLSGPMAADLSVILDGSGHYLVVEQSTAPTSAPAPTGGSGGVLSDTWQLVVRVLGQFASVAAILVTDPTRLFRLLVHYGHLAPQNAPGTAGLNLAILEATPLVGSLLAAPLILWRRGRSSLREWVDTPAGKTDVLVLVYGAVLTMFYLPVFPIHLQVTVRYLVPMVPGLLYLTFRLAPVRRAIAEAGRTGAWAYAIVVLIGSQVAVAGLVLTDADINAGGVLFAVTGLGTAIPLAVWTALSIRENRRATSRRGAILLGLAAGHATVFVLVYHLGYLNVVQGMPVVEAIGDLIPI